MISCDDIDAMKPDVRLVALTGLAGCGKSTAAQVFLDAGWKRVKFASPLKDMCRAMGMTDDMIEGHLKETPIDWLGGKTPRYVMQTIGTDWGRKMVSEGLWVDLATRDIRTALSAGHNVIVDDCRFQNEADAIRALGGAVVALVGRGGIAGSHESESGVGADIVYDNTGTVDELRGFFRYVFGI